MTTFLREYWLWITVPFLLVLGGIFALYFMAGDAATSPFVYPVF